MVKEMTGGDLVRTTESKKDVKIDETRIMTVTFLLCTEGGVNY